MKISDLGEFSLIDILRENISHFKDNNQYSWQRLVLDSGDDAAAWYGNESIQIATTDTMVEGVHFLPGMFLWEELGWRALAANLSDIAAMGGNPLYALVSLSLPTGTEVESVKALCYGMLKLSSQYGAALVGGNITKSPVTVITITVIGEMEGSELLKRSASKPGDRIAVTGQLGASVAATKVMTEGMSLDQETRSQLLKAHFYPQPRIEESKILLRSGVRSAIDISDGLVGDLTHICQASQVGAYIITDKLPIHPAVLDIFRDKSEYLVMEGGEDFELLFTAPDDVINEVSKALKTQVTVIGDIVSEHPGTVFVKDSQGHEISPKRRGWDHFSK